MSLLPNFFSSYNLAKKNKNFFFFLKYNKQVLKVLKIFLKKGLILSFFKNKNNKIKVFLQINNLFIFNKIKCYKYKNKIKTFNIKKLKKFKNKFIILNTSKGFLLIEDALKYKQGGILICELI